VLSSGRFTVSDIVSGGALPNEIKSDSNAWACCIGGALEHQEYLRGIKEAGFEDGQVLSSKEFYIEGEGSQALTKLLSIAVRACRREN
jgi:arsenite methyltransferase